MHAARIHQNLIPQTRTCLRSVYIPPTFKYRFGSVQRIITLYSIRTPKRDYPQNRGISPSFIFSARSSAFFCKKQVKTNTFISALYPSREVSLGRIFLSFRKMVPHRDPVPKMSIEYFHLQNISYRCIMVPVT